MSVCRDWVFKEVYKNNKLTKNARIIFIYLLAHCDDMGRIAIYHNDIENDIGVDTTTLYRALTRLANTVATYTLPNGDKVSTPMIIKEPKQKDCKAEMIIKIPCNDFTKAYGNKGKEYTNYVSLDFEGLKGAYLHTFRHAELRVMLYLFFRSFKAGRGNADEYCIFKSKGTAYKAIAEQIGLRVYTVRKAISRLIKQYEIEYATADEVNSYPWREKEKKLKKGNITYCIFSDFARKLSVEVSTSDKNEYGERIVDCSYREKHFRSDKHTLRNILRRQKRADYDFWNNLKNDRDINDIVVLMHQYRAYKRKKGIKINVESIFTKAISQCIVITAKLVHGAVKDILKVS